MVLLRPDRADRSRGASRSCDHRGDLLDGDDDAARCRPSRGCGADGRGWSGAILSGRASPTTVMPVRVLRPQVWRTDRREEMPEALIERHDAVYASAVPCAAERSGTSSKSEARTQGAGLARKRATGLASESVHRGTRFGVEDGPFDSARAIARMRRMMASSPRALSRGRCGVTAELGSRSGLVVPEEVGMCARACRDAWTAPHGEGDGDERHDNGAWRSPRTPDRSREAAIR